MEPSSRDDFVIAIRSAFLKKDTKQIFSFSAYFTYFNNIDFADTISGLLKFAKTSLNEIAYRSTFIFFSSRKFCKNNLHRDKNILFVYNKTRYLKKK